MTCKPLDIRLRDAGHRLDGRLVRFRAQIVSDASPVGNVTIQELYEDTGGGRPAAYGAKIRGGVPGGVSACARKQFIGEVHWIRGNKRTPGRPVFDIVDARDLGRPVHWPSAEELAGWTTDPGLYEKMVRSAVPKASIQHEVAEGLLMSAVRGTPGESYGGARNDAKINVNTLLVGEKGTGKTTVLKGFNKVLPGSAYTAGGTSKPPLATRIMPRSELREAGLLSLMTDNVLLVDDIDKIKRTGLDDIYKCMQYGHSSHRPYEYKEFINDTTIIAAGRPKGGRFDPRHETIYDNLAMDYEMVNWFDLIWCMKDVTGGRKDGREPDGTTLAAGEMQKLISHMRDIKVTLSEDVKDEIDDLYEELKDEKVRRIRMWDLYRIRNGVVAQAKLHMRKEASFEDVESVRRIYTASIESIRNCTGADGRHW